MAMDIQELTARRWVMAVGGWVEREGAAKRGFFKESVQLDVYSHLGALTAHSFHCVLVDSGGWRRRRKKSQLLCQDCQIIIRACRKTHCSEYLHNNHT